jgi:hypothetical protein
MIDEMTDIRKELDDRIQEVQQQMEPVVEISTARPSDNEGAQGSRKIVKENNKVYLYHKVDGEWYKTEMEKG